MLLQDITRVEHLTFSKMLKWRTKKEVVKKHIKYTIKEMYCIRFNIWTGLSTAQCSSAGKGLGPSVVSIIGTVGLRPHLWWQCCHLQYVTVRHQGIIPLTCPESVIILAFKFLPPVPTNSSELIQRSSSDWSPSTDVACFWPPCLASVLEKTAAFCLWPRVCGDPVRVLFAPSWLVVRCSVHSAGAPGSSPQACCVWVQLVSPFQSNKYFCFVTSAKMS